MHIFGKPKNRWGWVRVGGSVVLVGLAGWFVLAVLLRRVGEVAWLAWSGYQTFTLLDAVELAALPLLAVFAAAWLEDHDAHVESEQSRHEEAEQALAARRKEILRHVHEGIGELAPDAQHGAGGVPAQARVRLDKITRAALMDLDGKGKGELLHLLFEQGLLAGEQPLVNLRGADFSGAVLDKAHLSGACLEGVDLRKARLDGAHLGHARLTGANLRRAFLRRADLREAALDGSSLFAARLDSANLEGADLRDAVLDGAFLTRANLKHSTVSRLEKLELAVLIETTLPDGRIATNENGKEYLRSKEMADLIDRL